jgi:DNA invertase Pin-like site-specific DNA recombinase
MPFESCSDRGSVLTPTFAAEYRRASHEDQQFSTENQSAVNRAYAAAHGMAVVRTYSDEGKSGLVLDRRDALKQLLEDVKGGDTGFKVILVYDVSRWGRYQDPDEAAYYEYICKRAGIQVIYCAEHFANDGSPFSALLKAIKRASAAEYSRDLSARVFAGQCRLVRMGYNIGSPAPFGMRRLLIDRHGSAKGLLKRGELKNLATDRVVIVPGLPRQVKTIRWIFQTFTQGKMRETDIARALNRQGILNAAGRPWRGPNVQSVLLNERYIGNSVWNRTSGKLKTKRINNDPGNWVRADGASQAIVTEEVFRAAQTLIRDGAQKRSDDARLAPLRRLLRTHGRLSVKLINGAMGVPSAGTYHRWFGSLTRAYELVGYRGDRRRPTPVRCGRGTTYGASKERLLEALRQLLITRGSQSAAIIDECEDMPCAGTYKARFGSMTHAYELIGYNQRRARKRRRRGIIYTRALSNADLLDKLRALLAQRGYLTCWLIDASDDMPSSATYVYRFGSLQRAYRLIGYDAGRNSRPSLREEGLRYPDGSLLQGLKLLLKERGRLSLKIINQSNGVPSPGVYIRRFGSLSQAYKLIGYAGTSRMKSVNARAPAACCDYSAASGAQMKKTSR